MGNLRRTNEYLCGTNSLNVGFVQQTMSTVNFSFSRPFVNHWVWLPVNRSLLLQAIYSIIAKKLAAIAIAGQHARL